MGGLATNPSLAPTKPLSIRPDPQIVKLYIGGVKRRSLRRKGILRGSYRSVPGGADRRERFVPASSPSPESKSVYKCSYTRFYPLSLDLAEAVVNRFTGEKVPQSAN